MDNFNYNEIKNNNPTVYAQKNKKRDSHDNTSV